MAKKFPEVGATTPDEFSKLPSEAQRWLRKRRLWQSEWLTKEFSTGNVIFRLRARAKESQNRASIFLLLLFISVLIGLGYFVGLPLWRDYQESLFNADRARTEAGINIRESALNTRITSLRENISTLPRQWGLIPSGVESNLIDLVVLSSGVAIAVGEATVLRSENRGADWAAQPFAQDSVFTQVTNPRDGIVFLHGEGFYTSIDGGEKWSLNRSAIGKAHDFVDITTGWTVGERGFIARTTDGGNFWDHQQQSTFNALNDIDMLSDQVGWTVGASGTVLRTIDGGTQWKQIIAPSQGEDLFEVTFFSDRIGWILGENGTILVTRDGGDTWDPVDSPVEVDYFDIAFVDEAIGWIVGANGTIIHTKDGGLNWTEEIVPTSENLNGIFLADGDSVWVVGDGGTILKLSEDISGAILATVDAFQIQEVLQIENAKVGVDYSEYLLEANTLIQGLQEIETERVTARTGNTATTPLDIALEEAFQLTKAAKTADEREIARATLDLALRMRGDGSGWWKNYADQIPAGVLLLFLLATLGSLYRYNSRIAGFYHARADALELMALTTPPDQSQFDELAGTLAADRVEFKMSKTPADMATEITKEMINKLKLKPGP